MPESAVPKQPLRHLEPMHKHIGFRAYAHVFIEAGRNVVIGQAISLSQLSDGQPHLKQMFVDATHKHLYINWAT